jgi:myo-inositol-1(or 4)-monophosphatase
VNEKELDELLACAKEAAAKGSAELLVRFRGELNVRTKSSEDDPVTDADLASEEIIRSIIKKARPDDSLSGEEFADDINPNAKVRWSIDPLDGTVNYTRGIPFFSTSVAAQEISTGKWIIGVVVAPGLNMTYFAKAGGGAWLTRDGKTTQIFGPPKDRQTQVISTGFSYSAEERELQVAKLIEMMPRYGDLRRMGSAAIDACMVADGSIDVYYEKHIKEHDWAAAFMIAEEAGQRVRRPAFVGDFAAVNLD